MFGADEYAGAYDAENGVDGDKTTLFHTSIGDSAWWRVDLQNRHRIASVGIVNRGKLVRWGLPHVKLLI